MRATAAALRQVQPYKEGELAKVLAAADAPADGSEDAPLAEAPAVEEEPADAPADGSEDDASGDQGTDTEHMDEPAPAPQPATGKLNLQPVIPEALYIERMLKSEQDRLTGQITDTETLITKLRGEIDDRYKALKTAEEDLVDLQRADAICTAGLNKAAEPHPQRT